jgi:glycosyltransferase involved in cell wall biosynthesis
MSKVFVVGARGIPDVEGGVEKSAERIFPLVAARGWTVILVGLRQHIKSASFCGVELRAAPSSRILKTDKLLYYFSAVRMAMKLKPDVVHMQGLGSAIMLWAYKLMGAKTVVRYGSADYLLPNWGLIGRWGFLLAEYQLRFADAVIAVTPALAERLKARGISGNVHVITNATDSADAYAEAGGVSLPDQPYLLAVGRVTVQKNLHRLIEGFKLYAADRPDLSLVIAGGLDEETYVAGLRPLLSPQVRLLGRLTRSSMGPLYANARIYVNASIHEGMSNAVLEAISLGTPVLLSAIPENRDFQLGEKHYFDPMDVQSIAAALARADADPSAFVADRSAFLTWDMVAERTVQIYESFGLSPAHRSAAVGASA